MPIAGGEDDASNDSSRHAEAAVRSSQALLDAIHLSKSGSADAPPEDEDDESNSPVSVLQIREITSSESERSWAVHVEPAAVPDDHGPAQHARKIADGVPSAAGGLERRLSRRGLDHRPGP